MTSMEKRETLLGQESIGKLLVRLSVPATIGMIVGALYNVVDTIFIGRGVGALAIGGLTIAFPIQIFMMGLALMIGLGSASVVSRNLGAGNKERAYHTAGNAMSISIVFGLLIMLFGRIFLQPLIYLFGATDTLAVYAREYMSVILLGSVFITFAMAVNNLARAEGNATIAMISMVLGTGMNIILDPIFIFGFKMGIRGAAIATVISQGLSFSFLIIYFMSGKSILKIRLKHFIPNFKLLVEVFTLGVPSFIRHLGSVVFMTVLNNTLKVYGGDMYIAAAGVMNRLLSFAMMPVFGLAQGFQPIAGFNYGAKNLSRVKQSLKISLLASVITGTFFFLIMMIFPGSLMKLFTNDQTMIDIGKTALRIVVFALPAIGVQVIGATYFQAVGKAVPSLFLGMSRQVLFLIPLALLLPLLFGLNGVFLAFPSADIFATILTVTWLVKGVRGLEKDFTSQPVEAAT